jgi:peptidoglycan/LPS O-acetylase OafA/YrhL
LAQTFHLGRHPLPVLLIGLVSSYALAALSWSMLEQPSLGLKRYSRRELVGWTSASTLKMLQIAE